MNTFCRILCIIGFTLFPCFLLAQTNIPQSTNEYKKLAKSITKPYTNEYDKARAIYDWIYTNIEHHLLFQNNENTIDAQLYCNLYWHLAQNAGLNCNIISGIAKDIYGNTDNKEHYWINVLTDNDTILLDPAWGVGRVVNDEFVLSKDHSLWFDTNPYWFIFSHLPSESNFQYITPIIDLQTFDLFPPISPDCQYLGWDPCGLLQQCLLQKIKYTPYIFSIEKEKTLEVLTSPMLRVLNTDSTYTFEVKNPQHHTFGIRLNNHWYPAEQWEKIEDIYSIQITPVQDGILSLRIVDTDGQEVSLIQYLVSSPEGEEELEEEEQGPTINDLDFESIELINIPTHRKLNPATIYHFEIDNNDHKFAILVNNSWYYSTLWQQNDSIYSIDLLPAEEGTLKIMVLHTDNRYYPLVEYQVAKPTEEEKLFIRDHLPPIIYDLGLESIRLNDIPKYRYLNPATTYKFEIENTFQGLFAIVVNQTWYYSSQWQQQDSIYQLELMPTEGGSLKIMVQKPDQKYYPFVEYHITEPTEQEQEYIYLNRAPIIYNLGIETIHMLNIPKKHLLNPAATYRFEIDNSKQTPFAITVNNTWYYDTQWQKAEGIYTLDLMPAEAGVLKIMVQKTDQKYYPLVEYKITQPTEEEQKIINTYRQPIMHNLGINSVKLTDIPQYRKLNPATTYNFTIDNPEHIPFAITVNNKWYYAAQWDKQGSRYFLQLMPAEAGTLKIMLEKPGQGYYPYVEYQITQPTQKELEYIDTHKPPVVHHIDFATIQLIDKPKYKKLNPATIYHFELNNPEQLSFALAINGKWYYDYQWQKFGNRYAIDFLPAAGGSLKLLVKNPSQRYTPILEYEVTEPTEEEKVFIESHKQPTIKKLDFESILLIDIPKYYNLNPATTYHFEVENPNEIPFAITINNTNYHSSHWKKQGKRYSIDIIPAESGTLKLIVKNPKEGYSVLVDYQVALPTEQEQAYIDTHRSPILHSIDIASFQLVNIPQYAQLNPASIYRFEIKNPEHIPFAIIVNKKWYKSSDWHIDNDLYWIDILPAEAGTLKISIALEDEQYTSIVEYSISAPTKEEAKAIKAKKKSLSY